MAERNTEQDTAELQDLLEFLKGSRGFDFTGYKRATLKRRIEKRIQGVGVDGYASYQDYLEVNPREFTELFNTILINVTGFFRDPAAWEYMQSDAIPALLEQIPAPEPIRVWSAGCASGEEAYTTAMVLAEALGENEFRDRVKLYATDLDEDALNAARHAVYTNDSLKAVPEQLIDKYFEENASGLMFRQDLRRSIIFGRNDLVSDAPISRIDLLISRNVLMYFTPETQARILERFNFALNRTGFLFLGKSEMLITHGDLFTPHSLKWRVFRKVARNNFRERLAFVAGEGAEAPAERYAGVLAAAARLSPIAQIAVDRAGFLADANVRARELFSLGGADVGRPLQDLAISYRPAELRAAIDRAYEENAPVRIGRIEFVRPGGDERILEIDVTPVPGANGEPLGVTVMFNDVTTLARLHDDYDRSRRELETAYEELQSTVEELETTNEELQSTNEELETTNEELQSTNEELETMNEELQSTNDELETMNQEVNSRATELDRVHTFLEGILGSLGVGVAVIDRERTVQVWNAMSADLWGLRADEVEGQDFLKLDIGLPVAKLKDVLQRTLDGSGEVADQRMEAVNRRGSKFDCLVRVLPLHTRSGDAYGAVVLTAPLTDGASPLPDTIEPPS
jgi:two-component system CheB/CheR fusion protein